MQELNEYFLRRAGQDARRKIATIWVALRQADGKTVGFYSLSMAAVPLDALPADIQKKQPRYGNVPAIRSGRLAAALEVQGRGLGKYLFTDALLRCLRNEIAWALFLVDAKDNHSRQLYSHFGFFPFQENPNHLYLPRSVIEREYNSG